MTDFSNKKNLKAILANPKFNAQEFINTYMSSNSSDDTDMSIVQSRLNEISNEITEKIQNSIFDNYLTFIDAGKAISSLEINMHQIHNSINELKILISMASDKFHLRVQKMRDEIPTKTSEVFEEVHGLSSEDIDLNVKLCCVTDVVEYDIIQPKIQVNQIRIYLFENCLLTAYKAKSQDIYLTKENLYDINDIVFNESNLGDKPPYSIIMLYKKENRIFSFKDGLNMSYFKDTFGATLSNFIKQESKSHLHRDARNVVEVEYLSLDKEELIKDVISTTIPSVSNFIGIYSDSNIKIVEKKTNDESEKSWIEIKLSQLKETPEDLDVAIAEREFHKAIDILLKAKAAIKSLIEKKATDKDAINKDILSQLEELNKKLEDKSCHLASVLQLKIMQAADRHDSSKSVYVSVKQLILLGRRNFANELFLIYRSGIMNRLLTKSVRQEGNQSIYMNRLSLAFHKGIIESYLEWNNIIKTNWIGQTDGEVINKQDEYILNSSKISHWILTETEKYTEQIAQLLSDIRSFSFSSMCNSIERMKTHSKQIEKMLKIRIVPSLDKILLTTWQKCLNHQTNIIKESTEQRAESETWDTECNQTERQAWITELTASKILNADEYIHVLSTTTFRFSRSFLNFYISVCQLECLALQSTWMQNVGQLIGTVGEIFNKVLHDPKFASKKGDIRKNMEFLIRITFKFLAETAYNPIVDLDHYDLMINKFIKIYKSGL